MISTVILNILYIFVLGITILIGDFGDVSENNAITNGISALKGYYMSLNDFLPIDVIVAIIAFDLAFEAVLFLYRLLKWAYTKIPGVS